MNHAADEERPNEEERWAAIASILPLTEALRSLWGQSDDVTWPRFLLGDSRQSLLASGAERVARLPHEAPLGDVLNTASKLGELVVGAARFAPRRAGEAVAADFEPFGGGFFFAPRDATRHPVLRCPRRNAAPAALRAAAPNRYHAALRAAIAAVESGAIEKVVVARDFELTHPDGSLLDLRGQVPELVEALLAVAGDNTRVYLLAPSCDAVWLGATPERLLRMTTGRLMTEAVAGTCRIAENQDEVATAAAIATLLASDKDHREHQAVVDHLRVALAGFDACVEVQPTPTIRRAPGLAHLVTPITARLAPASSAIDVTVALHPTPAVNGVPAADALTFLLAHEGVDRGMYAGPIGFLHPEGACFDVGIRGALLTASGTRIFAGSGVVRGSTLAGESAETAAKASAIAESLGFRIAGVQEESC